MSSSQRSLKRSPLFTPLAPAEKPRIFESLALWHAICAGENGARVIFFVKFFATGIDLESIYDTNQNHALFFEKANQSELSVIGIV